MSQPPDKVRISAKHPSGAECSHFVLDAGEGEQGAADEQKQRYSPEDPGTLEQIKNLQHGCCVVMLR